MLEKMFMEMSKKCKEMSKKCAKAEKARKKRALASVEDEIKGLQAYKDKLAKEIS